MTKRSIKPSIPIRALPQIVRQVSIFTDRQTPSQIEAQIAATKELALSLARSIGIKRPAITEMFDIYVTSVFTDYPIYLLGHNAPRIETYQDALMHGNGCGQYTIVIRPKDQS